MTEVRNESHWKYVGVDVSKARLDISFETGPAKQCPRTEHRWAGWLKRQKQPGKLHVVVEATGGFEQLVVEGCHAQGIRCSVVNPQRARCFAKACGYMAKTDRVDARMLAAFGRDRLRGAGGRRSEEQRQLRALVDRRNDLLKLRTAEKNRIKAVGALVEHIQRHIDWLDAEVAGNTVAARARQLPLKTAARRPSRVASGGVQTKLEVPSNDGKARPVAETKHIPHVILCLPVSTRPSRKEKHGAQKVDTLASAVDWVCSSMQSNNGRWCSVFFSSVAHHGTRRTPQAHPTAILYAPLPQVSVFALWRVLRRLTRTALRPSPS